MSDVQDEERPAVVNVIGRGTQPVERIREDVFVTIHERNARVVQLVIACLTAVLMTTLICTTLILICVPNVPAELWREIAPLTVQGIVSLAAAALGHLFTKRGPSGA